MTKLEFKTQILKSRSTDHCQRIIGMVNQSCSLFPYLVDFAFDADEYLSFRASWIMDKYAEQYPAILTDEYIERIASEVVDHTNFSVTRTALRLLNREKLPEKSLGKLINQCFDWLAASSTPIAVKAYTMQFLYRVTIQEPDFKNELKILIEDQLPGGSAGFISRGKKILKRLR